MIRLFKKKGINILLGLLKQVKGSIYIVKAGYFEQEKQVLIGYGVKVNSEEPSIGYAGVTVYTHSLLEEELVTSNETEIVIIQGKKNKVPKNFARIFWEIINHLGDELENRIRVILSGPKKNPMKFKSAELIEPFSIDNNKALVRIELVIEGDRYREELHPYFIFSRGARRLYYFLFLRYIQYLCVRTFTFDGKECIKIPSKSFANNISKFLNALSESGVIDVLLEDEDSLQKILDGHQNNVLKNIVKGDGNIGVEKSFLYNDETGSFGLEGLDLAYLIFLMIGTPRFVPINLIIWVLDEYGDDLIKDRLKEIDLERFYGEEEQLFIGLVEDKANDDLYKSIHVISHSNLYKTNSEVEINDFKLALQKILYKYDVAQNKSAEGENEGRFHRIKSIFKGNKKDEDKEKSVSVATLTLFPAFDLAEKELRSRELAREISILFLSHKTDDVNHDALIEVSQKIMGFIRELSTKHIIWISKGWVYFQGGMIDTFEDDVDKTIYKLILEWGDLKENALRHRWNISGEFDVIGYSDVFSIFKLEHFKEVCKELDALFLLKQLFVRKVGNGFQVIRARPNEGEEAPEAMMMLERLVENPLPASGSGAWLKFIIHRRIKNWKGMVVLNGDLFRNVEYLDDLAHLMNSRVGLDFPRFQHITSILGELKELEESGFLKREIVNLSPITSVVKKVPEILDEHKALLLQMIPVLSQRYDR